MPSPVRRRVLRCVKNVIFYRFYWSELNDIFTFDFKCLSKVVNFRPLVFIFPIAGVIAFIEGNVVCSQEDFDCFPFLIR